MFELCLSWPRMATMHALGVRFRGCICVPGFLLATWVVGCSTLFSVEHVQAEDPTKGTSSREARNDAIAGIPLDQLTSEQRNRVREVVSNVSIYRRLPTRVIRCDPELYHFTLENPEIMVNIWQLLGLEDVTLERTGDQSYQVEDGAGTLGKVEFLHRSHNTQVVYGEGIYDGPMFIKPVRGECVIVMKSGYVRETDGHYYITGRLDIFVRLDRGSTADILAKTFRPLVGMVADHNFTQTMAFIQSLSDAAEVNPHGMHRLADKLTGVPENTREEFIAMTARVAERADQRRDASLQTVRGQTPATPVSASR